MIYDSKNILRNVQKQPPEVLHKKTTLKNLAIFTGKHLCWSRPATLLKKAPTQVLSCEYCKIFKNSYIEEHLRTVVSERTQPSVLLLIMTSH